ncbi:hypothetical protein SAMN05443572_103259 [Myxococcus fulvus]|uniref:Lipoprotein n=1 Tax=Myxococcus fulvus TaxID=33 RepID=A0A511T8R3_MYXFU|nr:DUF1579 domain-containing protein [Myxococcus fulvus]GEN10571.1 hypothetical protein MFU01_56080 [Myxococcus fulvus]SET79587.1 hypothetical protein SAMN05443572_103259 [Myxococcus fulvus]
MLARPSVSLFIAVVCVVGCRGTSSNAAPSPPSTADSTRAATSAIADAARELTGTWTCSGSIHGPSGASPSEVRFEARLELDKAWLRTDFVTVSGEYPYKFTSYRTFDATSRTWRNVILDNMGGEATSSSTDGSTWVGESTGPMGRMKIQDTERLVSPGKLTLRGQYSMDGVSWSTGYDLTCEK